MITNKEELQNITEDILLSEKDNFIDKTIFFVEAKVSNDNRMTVFIDSFEGIKVDDCAKLSKLIEANFDREEEDFELLVSSAGLDKPLKVLKQFEKNIGRTIKIQTIEGEKTKGILKEVSEKGIKIIPEIGKKKKNKNVEQESEVTFEFEHLKQVKLVITF
ncbi:MAG: ribosome assembly cofactor RimP [Chlorobi bacterium]|nr:ribosome assembly cofactor RimP [Chlorobiota bacterium]